MTDVQSTDLRSVKRLIIRGDGSFNADPKGDWVSARHFDEALAEIERLRGALEHIATFPKMRQATRISSIMRYARTLAGAQQVDVGEKHGG